MSLVAWNHGRIVEQPIQTPAPAIPLDSPTLPGYFQWKILSSRIVGLALLVPTLPVILLLMALVRLTTGSPPIYRQQRVGLNGKTFWLYKIRSMRQDAESNSGPVWATKNDPRVTRLGRFLRGTHLDELPQLINIVRGEMSLIGPRPERPEFLDMLIEQIPGYMDRYKVLPGITGLAQVNLPPDSDITSVQRKVQVDKDYIRNGSLLLDLRITVHSMLYLCGMPEDLAGRLTGTHRVPVLVEATATRVDERPPYAASTMGRPHIADGVEDRIDSTC